MNRSVDGDVVAVEIFPEAEWKVPGDEVVDQDCTISASAGVFRNSSKVISCTEG